MEAEDWPRRFMKSCSTSADAFKARRAVGSQGQGPGDLVPTPCAAVVNASHMDASVTMDDKDGEKDKNLQ